MGNKPQRIGIMGGTFDPIHMGHLLMAESVRMDYDLDKVLFIPTGTSPHISGSHARRTAAGSTTPEQTTSVNCVTS